MINGLTRVVIDMTILDDGEIVADHITKVYVNGVLLGHLTSLELKLDGTQKVAHLEYKMQHTIAEENNL